ncbi:F0F1 ATP synthase subunit B' [Paracoccus sp. S-4012]|uniref:F0F1 ATP synthase subunit B' n=1 Tax=Paracoccus sp. S-4012 TaxID=2665648 RepID=UPI0012AF62E3|nr:F0F1 ATP synthase subunit B' [Paracoccus sp. S-4012]MRX49978.1 F0F1 ATP synthase subunit B' [Paracoccus sp. S-4012]
MITLLQQTTAPVAVETTSPEAGAVTITVPPGSSPPSVEAAIEGALPTVTMPMTTAPAPESAGGIPQIDFTTFGNQIFWLILTIVASWWVLSRVALPRIGGVLADRQNAISGDLGAAEEFKRKARDAESAYEKALAAARSEAQGIAAEQKAGVQAEIDAAIAHADAEIAARAAESERRIGEIRESSLDDARSVAREVTAELVRAFGGQPDEASVTAAVDRRLQAAS